MLQGGNDYETINFHPHKYVDENFHGLAFLLSFIGNAV